MSLADALAYRLAATEVRCPVADLLPTLTPDDADALRRALEPRAMDINAVARILKANGNVIGEDRLRAHRAAIARSRGIPVQTFPCSCTDL